MDGHGWTYMDVGWAWVGCVAICWAICCSKIQDVSQMLTTIWVTKTTENQNISEPFRTNQRISKNRLTLPNRCTLQTCANKVRVVEGMVVADSRTSMYSLRHHCASCNSDAKILDSHATHCHAMPIHVHSNRLKSLFRKHIQIIYFILFQITVSARFILFQFPHQISQMIWIVMNCI